MPPITDFIYGVAMPVLVGFLASLAATSGERRPWWRGLMAVLLVGVAYAAARWLMWGWPGLPPRSIFHWLGFIALGAAVAGAATLTLSWRSRFVVAVALGMLALAPFILRDPDLSTLSRVAGIVGLGALLGAVAAASEGAVRRAPVSTLAALVATLTVTSISLVLVHSVPQAQAMGIVCAALGGAWGATWFTRRAPHGVALLAVLINGAALLAQCRFNECPLPVAVLLALAPLGVLLGDLPPLRGRTAVAVTARLVGVLVPAGIALGLAVADAAADSAASAGY
jgi:hypothetical protein